MTGQDDRPVRGDLRPDQHPGDKAITSGDFRSLARRAGFDGDWVAGVVRDTVIAPAESWSQTKAEADVPAFVASPIEGRLRTLPLVAETRQGS